MCWPAAGSRKLPQAVRLWDLGKEGKVKGSGALVLPSALVPLRKSVRVVWWRSEHTSSVPEHSLLDSQAA